jgi:hypothetical protein
MKKITKVFDTQSDWVSKVFIALMVMIGVVLFGASVMAIQTNWYVWWLVPFDCLFLWGVLHPYIRNQFQWYADTTDQIATLFIVALLLLYLAWDYLSEEYQKIQTYHVIMLLFYLLMWCAFLWIMFNQT